jgi:hypothetical protein
MRREDSERTVAATEEREDRAHGTGVLLLNTEDVPDDLAGTRRGPQEEANRKLENIVRILVESYEQTAALALLTARESDLRTANMRATYLATEAEQPVFIWEAVFSAVFAALLPTIGKLLPEEVCAWAAWLVHSVTDRNLDPLEAGMAGLAVAVLAPITLWTFVKWWRGKKNAGARKILIKSLQKISDLYVRHSTLSSRLQRARQMRVQTEAKMHQYTLLTWNEIGDTGGAAEMRRYLDTIAEIGRQCSQDEAEYNRAGGDYWLEMLRSTLRGELPAFICFYVEAVRERGTDPAARKKAFRRWHADALNLCRAERKVFGGDFALKDEAYGAIARQLGRTVTFAPNALANLLASWQHHFPQFGLRNNEEQRRFLTCFKAWLE